MAALDDAPETTAPVADAALATHAGRARCALEPERVYATPSDAFSREAYFDSGIGVLVEQGNLERARVLLAKRASTQPSDPMLYLDAIRMERVASPDARAWQAWLSQAPTYSSQASQNG